MRYDLRHDLDSIGGVGIIGRVIVASLALYGIYPARAQQPSPPAPQPSLTPQQTEMVRPFLQPRPLPQGGEIIGFVSALLPGSPELRDVALPAAHVFARTDSGAPDQHGTETDSQGRFRIPVLPPGSYNVCASLPGFTTACASTTVANQNVSIPSPIALKPDGPVLRGCVTLKDGTPAIPARCHRTSRRALPK
jgi:hypothetical protein